MKREFLKALGLSDEAIDKIMAENGADIEKAKGDLEEQKTKLQTTETELTNVKTQLQTANTEIESYKSMDIEAIKASADSYKTKYEATKTDLEKQIESLKFEHSIENALSKAGAKNTKAAKALLDIEALKGSKNRDSDIEAAITTLKETETYLFGESDPAGTGGSMGAGGKPGGKAITVEEFNKMTYKERTKLYSENPTLYNELTK